MIPIHADIWSGFLGLKKAHLRNISAGVPLQILHQKCYHSQPEITYVLSLQIANIQKKRKATGTQHYLCPITHSGLQINKKFKTTKTTKELVRCIGTLIKLTHNSNTSSFWKARVAPIQTEYFIFISLCDDLCSFCIPHLELCRRSQLNEPVTSHVPGRHQRLRFKYTFVYYTINKKIFKKSNLSTSILVRF